jgi:hypothetical protein
MAQLLQQFLIFGRGEYGCSANERNWDKYNNEEYPFDKRRLLAIPDSPKRNRRLSFICLSFVFYLRVFAFLCGRIRVYCSRTGQTFKAASALS